jgi:hypothetical protein
MTRRAGDPAGLARLAEAAIVAVVPRDDRTGDPFFEKQHLAQPGSPRVVTECVGRVGWRRFR